MFSSFLSLPWWILLIFSIASVLVLLFVLWAIAIIVHWAFNALGFVWADTLSEEGVIINKYLKGNDTGPGIGLTTEGQVAMTLPSSEGECIIEYRSDTDGRKYRIRTDRKTYDSLENGDKVQAYYKMSKTTKEFRWTGEIRRC